MGVGPLHTQISYIDSHNFSSSEKRKDFDCKPMAPIGEQFPSDGVFCVFVFFLCFCWHTNAQMRKCTNSCSRLIDLSLNAPIFAWSLRN